MLVNIVVAIQILAAIAMAGFVLVQHGKGADMGAAFGSGSAGGLFGSSGSANFLSRMTAVSATVFFISTLGLAYMAGQGLRQPSNADTSVLENAPFVLPSTESGSVSAIPGGISAPAIPAATPAAAPATPVAAPEVPAEAAPAAQAPAATEPAATEPAVVTETAPATAPTTPTAAEQAPATEQAPAAAK